MSMPKVLKSTSGPKLSSNRVKFSSTEGKCLKRYRQLQTEVQPCQKINFDSMTEELQADYLDKYEGVQAPLYQVSQLVTLVLQVPHIEIELIRKGKLL